ncbi:unnamed protein product [Leptidea sinapis]|nr:unnamed protein product [Leptidea sinapis]
MTGPNLWICLQPECHHVGCSEVKNDHSTIHHQKFPLHCVHMNVSTERIWCYLCEKEVHIRAALAQRKMSPDSTCIEGFVSPRVGSGGISVNNDELDQDDMDYDGDQRPRGLVGLQNMGNTCYMNAALQALSNTQPLTSYFLECAGAVAVLAADKKPGLSRAYQKLMKDMWSRRTRGYVVPNGILYGMRNEFLRCFMDQLHEELKEPVLDGTPEDKLASESENEHQESRNYRRRAVMRKKSPASSYTEPRHDGYLRIESQREGARHRRSASFAGTHFAYNSPQRDIGSESELSGSSEAEERYETCSSGASDTDLHIHNVCGGGGDGGRGGGGRGQRFRSIVSDVFDGRLLSSVQCLICNRVSTRVETFQDLSLPIPSREHVTVLRCQQPALTHVQDSWLWWFLSWLRSWFYGPMVSLQDCLAAFFIVPDAINFATASRCRAW